MLSKLAQLMRRLSQCDPPPGNDIPVPITLSDMEHRQLNVLAMTGRSHDSTASDRLYWELDRARVVPVRELSDGIVRMGSIVTYQTSAGSRQWVQVVYPEQAYRRNSVSILSPLGTALIGVAAGDTIPWSSSGGEAGTLTVLTVSGP